MSNAAISIETSSFRGLRMSGRSVFGLAFAAAAFIPLAVVGVGLLRGGVEPYIVLAALLLG